MQKADNDILAIQKELDGRMALMGGIETSIVDTEDATMDRGLYIKRVSQHPLRYPTISSCFLPAID